MQKVTSEKCTEGISVRIYTSKTENVQRLQSLGLNCTVTPKANIAFAIIDSKTVWYGNVNYLAQTHYKDEHTIRIIAPTLAPPSWITSHLGVGPPNLCSIPDRLYQPPDHINIFCHESSQNKIN